MAPINLFDLYAKISLDDSEYNQGVDKAGEKGQSLASKLGSGLATAGKAAATGLGVIAGAASTVVGGLVALESSTEEYRKAQGRLNTAFEAAGYSTETAAQAYNAFYGILGDTDTATEASQLLAKLAESEEDVATWTNIAAGVSGTFGDSLPIEGLIEAANETAKVGQVTGTLADALNWAGISEDEFNAKLAACGSESERNQLIMSTLSGTYDEASEAFYRNNEALVESRNNQAQLDAVMAQLGGTVSTVKNNLLSQFMPAIASVGSALSGMVTGVQGADVAFSTAVQGLVNALVQQLPGFLNMGVQVITALASGIISSIPTLAAAIPQVLTSIGTAITALLPQLLVMGGQLLQMLAQGFQTGIPTFLAAIPVLLSQMINYFTLNLPQMLQMGVSIINGIVNGIMQGIPTLLAALPQVINSITAFFTSAAPQILQAGMEVLQNLINGIVQTIPQLVAALPQILQAFINFITSALPTILQSGIQMLQSLVQGILQALPELIAAIPQVIAGFVETIVANLPQILQTGVQLLGQFIQGIIQTIPQLVSALPQIISAIVSGIGSLMGSIINIGGDIVRGIWQGISGAAGWLWSQITGWFSGIVDGIKGLFGIASPSKLMRDEIGRNIGLGVAEGIMDTTANAVDAASSMGKEVYNSTARWVDLQNQLMGSLEEPPEEGLFGASVMAQLPLMMEQLQVFFEENLPLLQQIGVRMMTSVASGFEQTMPELYKLAPVAVNSVVSGIRGRIGQLVNLGSEMVRGIWRGIEANKAWITSNFMGWIDDVLSAVKSALKISSPSKVFRDEVGKNIALGVVEGIVQTTGEAVKAAEYMGRSVYEASAAWLEQQDALAASYDWTAPQFATQRTGAIQQASQTWGVGTLVQNIQAVPLTPAELARQSVDAIRRLRWA